MRLGLAFARSLVLLAAAAPATAETFDLHIHAYCPTGGKFCGISAYSAYRDYVLETVQEINVQWQATGISFRPAFIPLPLTIENYIEAQCKDVEGTAANELTLYRQWLQNVAAASPGSISILLNPDNKGQGCCSQLPNNASYPWYERFGILCNHSMQAYDLGSVLAHELGHHFCLCHTFLMSSFYGSPMDTEEFLPDDLLYGPLDWDGDDESCPRGLLGAAFDVLDTDPDPREFEAFDPDEPAQSLDEDSGFARRNDHEWCTAQVNGPVDQGSVHGASCTTVCGRRSNNQTNFAWVPPGTTAERAALAMSYWDDFGRCHGPWTRGAKLFNAFTPGSVNRIRECRQAYRSTGSTNPLIDVCATRGGDLDRDGICQLDDNCPLIRNTNQKDTDHDGIGDLCDLCPLDPTPTGDTDHDGIGDACDPDLDGDGCANHVDQHPNEAKPVTGSVLYVGCNSGLTATRTFEGEDSDGDGWINCRDLDDDNDGVCDEGAWAFGLPGVPQGGCVAGPDGVDPCPVNATGNCHFEVPFADCKPPWFVCNGPCDGFFLRLVPIGDPDLGSLTIGSFQIVNDMLYLAPMADRTLSRTARALQGDFESLAVPAVQQGNLRGATVGALRLEIWKEQCSLPDPDYPPNPCFVAVVAEYPADAADFGDVSRGRYLAVRPEGASLGGGAVWAPGLDPAAPPPLDTDGDGWPDFHDNCILDPNPSQTDADADGFGNACDSDLDGDFLVRAADLEAVQGCLGADLLMRHPLVEPDWLGGKPREVADRTAYDLADRCAPADVNDDGIVDADDELLTERRQGLPPGPSASSEDSSACAEPGACDDGNPCTSDRCVHSTGECLHLVGVCDDFDPCTIDSCDPASGSCDSVPMICDDGNACTEDSCNPIDGSCIFEAAGRDGANCDDGSACTASDICRAGSCIGTPVVSCDDADPCTIDACDPESGACVVAGDACDDGNPCTLDSCSRVGCLHEAVIDGSVCEDGDLCTEGDSCAAGTCRSGVAMNCDDGDACTYEECDSRTGECFQVPVDCADGDACTADACSSGECSHLSLLPAPVGRLVFTNKYTLVWDAPDDQSHSNTYRGTIPPGGMANRAAPYDHACFENADLGADGPAASSDLSRPAPGEGFYYLVASESACGEGFLGNGSSGAPRPNDRPCPARSF